MQADFLSQQICGNTIENYLWFAGIILVGLIFKNLISRFLSYILYQFLSKYFKSVGVRTFVELLLKPFSFIIFLMVVYIACNQLHFPEEWHLASEEEFGVRMTLKKVFQTVFIFSVVWMLLRVIDYIGLVLFERAKHTESKTDDQLIPFLKTAIKVIIIFMAMFFILGAIFEFNIASVIAGLGIGGLAFALAAKETLENLLGSFLIFLDKPFTVGDLVQVAGVRGHVEEVGFRSTKIRTLEKTLVTVANKKMVDAELENQTERTFVRAKTIIGLTYSTSELQIKNIISDLKHYLKQHESLRENPSVNFTNFGVSALEIEIVYFVVTTDLDFFAEMREQINFKIMEIVAGHNSSFAFPTTTVYLERPQESK